jgi:hypothetical protein
MLFLQTRRIHWTRPDSPTALDTRASPPPAEAVPGKRADPTSISSRENRKQAEDADEIMLRVVVSSIICEDGHESVWPCSGRTGPDHWSCELSPTTGYSQSGPSNYQPEPLSPSSSTLYNTWTRDLDVKLLCTYHHPYITSPLDLTSRPHLSTSPLDLTSRPHLSTLPHQPVLKTPQTQKNAQNPRQKKQPTASLR